MLPVSIEKYRAELTRVVELLTRGDVHACLRGDGAGSFVVADSPRGSAEISRSEDHWWLEFWMPNGEEPFVEKRVADWETAGQVTQHFLKTGDVVD